MGIRMSTQDHGHATRRVIFQISPVRPQASVRVWSCYMQDDTGELVRLFREEVPEIALGSVEIKKEKNMPYVPQTIQLFHNEGMRMGLLKAIERGLRSRFGEERVKLVAERRDTGSLDVLDRGLGFIQPGRIARTDSFYLGGLKIEKPLPAIVIR